jgi:hypothetical protein
VENGATPVKFCYPIIHTGVALFTINSLVNQLIITINLTYTGFGCFGEETNLLSCHRQELYLLSKASDLPWGPTNLIFCTYWELLPQQCNNRSVCPLTAISSQGQECVELYLHFPIYIHVMHRDNLTLTLPQ